MPVLAFDADAAGPDFVQETCGLQTAAHRSEPAIAVGPDAAGRPVLFSRFGGFYHPGSPHARIAVLLLSPLGYEELCTRATWRLFADMMATAGLPCLRFDFPGTGDALDPEEAPSGLADWRAAAHEAARRLVRLSGCNHLVLVGQGLGGALAAELAPEIDGVDATVLMAPVVSGRAYLREMRAWAKVMADGIGIGQDPADTESYDVAGMVLPAGRAAAIKAIDLAGLEKAPGSRVLLVARPRAPAPKSLVARLDGLGSAVSHLVYDGYDTLLSDPTEARPPLATLGAITSWIGDLSATLPPRLPLPSWPTDPTSTALTGEGFAETPLRFGDGALFGILCRPLQPHGSSAVLLVNAGRDYHIGWGRATVNQARALARAGFTSFRFDISGMGDSPAGADSTEILYTARQVADVQAAIDHLDALGFRNVTLIGRCSGAYAAFHAGSTDPRVAAVVLINISRLVWNPRETVADAMKFAHRSIGDLGARLASGDGLRRLLAGKLRVRAALGFVGRRLADKLGRSFALLPGRLTLQARLFDEVHRRFRALRDRNAAVTLIYSSGDGSLPELANYMGRRERRLAAYPNVTRIEVPDADHNFTHRGAQAELLGHLLRVLAER